MNTTQNGRQPEALAQLVTWQKLKLGGHNFYSMTPTGHNSYNPRNYKYEHIYNVFISIIPWFTSCKLKIYLLKADNSNTCAFNLEKTTSLFIQREEIYGQLVWPVMVALHLCSNILFCKQIEFSAWPIALNLNNVFSCDAHSSTVSSGSVRQQATPNWR